jgi:hypothetical protein
VSVRTPQFEQSIRAALLPVGMQWTLGIEVADEARRPTTAAVQVALEPSTGGMLAWTSRVDVQDVHYTCSTRRLREDGSLGDAATYNRNRVGAIANTFLHVDRHGRGLFLFNVVSNGTNEDDVMQVLFR